jgi:L-lactate dehydrogenase complex protein LldG
MSSRENILGALRRNQPAARPLPDVPMFDADLPPALEKFKSSVTRMGGKVVELPHGSDLTAFIRARFPDAREICSATPEVTGTRDLGAVRAPADLNDVDVGVVRARFGVAETGSVFLSETELGINAIGYLVQHLVVFLDPKEIVPNLHHAYQNSVFREVRYAVLMTGPSATADIEGILIHGAQGVRSLTVALVPRAAEA